MTEKEHKITLIPDSKYTLSDIVDDAFILAYLRGCKFSFEKTKKKIDMWHAMRAHCPEYYTGWDPLEKKNNDILSHG